MRILSVAYPLLPVSGDAAGGAEQILYLLEAGLVRAGHQSTVIAAAGSRVSGKLIATRCASGQITEELRCEAQREHLNSICEVLLNQEVDVIHFHGLDFDSYFPQTQVAKLATLHLPLPWYSPSIFEVPGLKLSCVSRSQADSAPDKRKLAVVPNGIDLARYQSSPSSRLRQEYLLWIGRVCPEKGVHICLEVAHETGLPAIIAGPVHPFRDHQSYFSERVQPLLDAQRQYVGPVGLEQKTELLAHAKCLLIPSLVAETSSLVAMEAISSGTPVIAYGSGALPEVVRHGVTGLIVDSQQEMAASIEKLSEISPERCREEARERFDASKMVVEYIKLYDSLLLSI